MIGEGNSGSNPFERLAVFLGKIVAKVFELFWKLLNKLYDDW